MEAMYTCVPLAWAETATATGYYFWKAKNENRAKYAQKFLKGMQKNRVEKADVLVRGVVMHGRFLSAFLRGCRRRTDRRA